MNKAALKDALLSKGVESAFLDDIVHGTASVLASNANNGGMESQIEFLMDTCGFGADDILNRI